MSAVSDLQEAVRRERPRTLLAFALAAVFTIVLVATDQQASTLLPLSLWAKVRMIGCPFKMTTLGLVVAAIGATVYYFASRAPNATSLLLIVTLIALQTNGALKFGPIDLITVMPFVVILHVLARSFRDPSYQTVLPGILFFGALLILLDIPYLGFPHVYGPIRYIINFISLLKGVLVAFIFVNLLRTERDLEFAIRAFLIVAFVSAMIGVAQIALNYFTGITINFASEAAERKPNFLGMTLRATGLTTWPSWLSDFLVFALPFMMFRLLNARSLAWAAAYGFGILALVAGIVLTFTYAAYFGVVVIFALFPFAYWPQRTVHFVAALLIVCALFQFAGGFEWAYNKGLTKVLQSTGMVERRTYLQSTLGEIARDPWVGSGIYAEEEFSENFYRKRVHNSGLQAWADLGLPGLLTFVTMLLAVLTQLWLMAGATRGKNRQLFQALGLGVTAMILEMFAEPNMTVAVTWFYLGLCQAALLIHCTWRYPRPLFSALRVARGPTRPARNGTAA